MINQSPLIQYAHPFGVKYFQASDLDKLFLYEVIKGEKFEREIKKNPKFIPQN